MAANSKIEWTGQRTSRDTAPCARCGRLAHIDELDAKPDARVMARYRSLEEAADAGAQFTRLECEDCYGLGYSSLRSK